MTIGAREYRDTLGRYPTGVTVVTTVDDAGNMYGATIGSFSSLSLDPPLVLFSLDKRADCFPAFTASRCFVVNVLGEDQQQLSRIFSSKAERPWDDLEFTKGETGAPLMTGCIAHIECTTEAIHGGGDHDIFIGRVVAVGQTAAGRPLLHFGGAYRKLDLDPDC